MSRYNPAEIQAKWQKKWASDKTFVVDLEKSSKPFYNLMMFPYPSGEGLHVGHVYAFGGADTFGHFKKMQGYDVFEPMGFDSFGIHSENYAIKVGKHPKELIDQTTEYFKEEQLAKIGALFDWEHSVTTSDPQYYKWTQWLFIQLFKAGLAVRKKAAVDWCPSCKTVLADEQVITGKCERCSSEVIQKELEQWFFKITDYAQRLLDNLDQIDWSETTKTMQRNWIGKSEGAEIDFPIKDSHEKLKVFTTRPDTIYGATFMVVAPEHPIVNLIGSSEVKDYVAKAKNKSEVERQTQKSGVFSGMLAINPFTKKEIPIWIADYVLMGYGTGAIMAVPAHDQRDYDFAKKYALEILEVISGGQVDKKAWSGQGKLVNSGDFDGQVVQEAKKNISNYIETNKLGSVKVNFHLRDWLISRQRYWGPPIPMIFCERCATNSKGERSEMPGWYSVPESDLPVELPEISDYQPEGSGVSPLAGLPSFLRVKCPGCGENARRETDVSDTFLDSSWYFLRYPSVGNDQVAFDPEITKKWLPVDSYIGGNEHAVLHLLYTRFITMVLHDLKFIDFDEPFKKFRAHGLVIYKGAKMSKSRGNVVNPAEYFDAYGSDALKMYLLFIGPYELGGEFNDRAITGVYRFLNRVYTLVAEFKKESSGKPKDQLLIALNHLNQKVADDLENLRFNTAVAALMEFLNLMYKHRTDLSVEVLKSYILILAPLAPFLAEESWEILGEDGSVHTQSWPGLVEVTNQDSEVAIVVQVNGVFRDKITIAKGSSEEEVVQAALKAEKVAKYTEAKEIAKRVWVEYKLINFVVK